jgi:putative flippase GtrA
MKFKRFIVGLASFLITTALLYIVGYLFHIPMLTYHHQYLENANGFSISIDSIIPLIIGLIVSYFAEKIYVYKQRQKIS